MREDLKEVSSAEGIVHQRRRPGDEAGDVGGSCES